jgi:hypothetical protein
MTMLLINLVYPHFNKNWRYRTKFMLVLYICEYYH